MYYYFTIIIYVLKSHVLLDIIKCREKVFAPFLFLFLFLHIFHT